MSGGSAPSEMSLLTCNDGSFQVFQKFYLYGGLLLQNTKLLAVGEHVCLVPFSPPVKAINSFLKNVGIYLSKQHFLKKHFEVKQDDRNRVI